MKVAVVGATGLVGTVILKVLEERQFPVSELLPVASERSVGRTVCFAGSEVPSPPGPRSPGSWLPVLPPSDAGWWTIPPAGGWTPLSRW